jgi:hypothetical protein
VTPAQIAQLQAAFDEYLSDSNTQWTYGAVECLRQEVSAQDELLRALCATLGVDVRRPKDRT